MTHDGYLCGYCYTREFFPVCHRFLGSEPLPTIARCVEFSSSLVHMEECVQSGSWASTRFIPARS
ncbi:hypothetical protein AK973_3046 [Pseudomonas brassicacearum]|nr:hypothetical protein AK973_3046 [Pseudomonas brassicacearum]